ncbi:hypothetical protein GPA27_01960 [Aromatoleum toluolicum]|uniref:Uracil-DNA glycosylase-like domain-containing protein n=1 Tax=Aromatoleum toluolicum TaxID=90060 RepID=A0ABX1NAA5_9RHOO|nr:hypothetical protein [Aromatoleum toluolicum]NMF96160.1 hypothetical protein [Aromatoleum toluolicum]
MKSSGDISSSVWLIGDSNPQGWSKELDVALDPKHPTRHSIWTPILNEIQGYAFSAGRRVDCSKIHIRNAISNHRLRPSTEAEWARLEKRLCSFRERFSRSRPKLILTFGGFAFEFCRRAIELPVENEKFKRYTSWTVKGLAKEFHERSSPPKTIVPLLHASIARGKFLDCHEAYTSSKTGNYFSHVGKILAERLLVHHENEDIWHFARE